MAGCPVHHHGVSKVHGCDHASLSHFSKMFDLPPLAVSEALAAFLGGPGGLMHDFDDESPDCAIPAGYTFFAQFIDHDITLDATSGLRDAPKSDEDIAHLPNFRSPTVDLDCVYGFGPDASPHIYDADRPGHLAVNPNGYDLARSPSGVALIGDPRNDENIFVAQMQLLFHRFHNKIYDERVQRETSAEPFNRFEEAQKQTRYHYQWLLLFDFLKRLCDPDVYSFAANLLLNDDPNFPFFPALDDHHKMTMPVEFSVAAYRVGHTLVRSRYAVNADNQDVELFDERFGTLGFSPTTPPLQVDWKYLLPVVKCVVPRMCKAIDPKLTDEIQVMPDPVVSSNNPLNKALAFRNLLRGNALSLPSGQAAAGALNGAGYPVSVKSGMDLGFASLPPGAPADFDPDNLPLFYYLLQESWVVHQGQRFGPAGSAILMDVFGGMLKNCKTSFLKETAEWNPDPCISKERYAWWIEEYREGFSRHALINSRGYYPFELADVVRFVEGIE